MCRTTLEERTQELRMSSTKTVEAEMHLYHPVSWTPGELVPKACLKANPGRNCTELQKQKEDLKLPSKKKRVSNYRTYLKPQKHISELLQNSNMVKHKETGESQPKNLGSKQQMKHGRSTSSVGMWARQSRQTPRSWKWPSKKRWPDGMACKGHRLKNWVSLTKTAKSHNWSDSIGNTTAE